MFWPQTRLRRREKFRRSDNRMMIFGRILVFVSATKYNVYMYNVLVNLSAYLPLFCKNITESVGFGETCCLAVRLPFFFFWFHHSIVHPVAYNTISILISLGTFVSYPPPSPQLACRFLYTSFFLQRCNWAKICTPQDGTAMSSVDYNQFGRWASYQNPNHGKTDALSHVTREYFFWLGVWPPLKWMSTTATILLSFPIP